jgi:hypothetical protein
MAFRMPTPIVNHTPLHRALIRQAMPKAEWIRINGGDLLSLRRKGIIAKALRKADRIYLSWEKKLQSKLSGDRDGALFLDNEELRADSLLGSLGDPIRDILAANNSISTSLIGRKGVDHLFGNNPHKRKTYAGLIGSLMTMERWKKLVDTVAPGARGV